MGFEWLTGCNLLLSYSRLFRILTITSNLIPKSDELVERKTIISVRLRKCVHLLYNLKLFVQK